MDEPTPAPGGAIATPHDDVVRALRRSTAERRSREPDRPGRRRRRRTRRLPRLLVAVVVALALGVAAIVLRADSGGDGSLPASAPPPGSPGWTEVVERLDRSRTAALVAGDEGALKALVAPGSTPERTDRAALRRLRASGLRPRGLDLVVLHVGVRDRGEDRVVLRVVDTRPAYALVDRHGAIVGRVAARGARAWSLVLVHVGGGWRTASVTPLR